MASDDWFREPALTEDAKAAFEERLAKARSSRSEYMRIQAFALAEVGAHKAAIELNERLLAEHDDVDTRFVLRQLRDSHRALGHGDFSFEQLQASIRNTSADESAGAREQRKAQQDAEDAECAARREDAKRQRQEERPILDELVAVGVSTAWIGGVPHIDDPDPRIYPILFDHLTRPYSPLTLYWLGGAFGQKSARPHAWHRLLQLLNDHVLKPSAAKGALLSMSQMATPSDLATVINLISDTRLGEGRIFLVSNLMRSKRPEARAALVQLRDDPDLHKEVAYRLRKSRI